MGEKTYELVWRDASRWKAGGRVALHWWKNAYGSELPPRGYVFLVHGIGEHGGRYAEVARYLCQFGFDCLIPDLPAHGLSRKEGGLMQLLDFDDYVRDNIDTFSYWLNEGPRAKNRPQSTPWFLVGHSMGALICLNWIMKGKLLQKNSDFSFAERAFLSAPPLKLRVPIPAHKLFLGEALSKGALKDITLKNVIESEYLSFDGANIGAHSMDPLIHQRVSPRLFASMNETAAYVQAHPLEVEIPLCLVVGENDPIVDPRAIKDFFNALSTDKKYYEFKHTKHEVLFDVKRSHVFRSLLEWIL